MTESGAASHSRESSISQASSESLVLSVSALSRVGGQPAHSPRSEESNESLSSEFSYVMGATASNSEDGDGNLEGSGVRPEPEGISETDGPNFTSFLSVDKRLFGRLQEELTQAQSQLKLKEEQVVKLSRIRDDVEREMEDLTASLFQVNRLFIEHLLKILFHFFPVCSIK